MERAEHILNWLKDRPGLKASVILEATGMKAANWSVIVNGTKKIPEKYLPQIEKALMLYGYQPVQMDTDQQPDQVVHVKNLNLPTQEVQFLPQKPPATNYTINTKTEEKEPEAEWTIKAKFDVPPPRPTNLEFTGMELKLKQAEWDELYG